MPRITPSDAFDDEEVEEGFVRGPCLNICWGAGEILDDEIEAIAHAFEGPVTCFEAQFSTYSKQVDVDALASSYTAAHDWLSEHATGPWLWTESGSNHDHSGDISVYVERTVDQEAFRQAFPELFGYRPSSRSDLLRLAVFRGALPLPTGRESFGAWMDENTGFRLLHADDIGDKAVRVVLTHPDIERRFLERFGSVFRAEERAGGIAYVATDQPRHGDDSPTAWLRENAAIGGLSGGPDGEGGYRYSVEIRLPDVAEALQRDWGHIFSAADDGRRFHTPDYPSSPDRSLPEDFAAYLKGEADTYEAPHLPEALRAWRTVPDAPRPTL